MQDFRSRVADDFGPKTMAEYVTLCLTRDGRSWGVWADGELCGVVVYEPLSAVTGNSHFYFRKDYWGREVTEAALRLVSAEIFAGGVNKICGCPFRDNNAVISVSMAIGAKREGVLRQQTRRGGRFVDVVVMGLLKEDFEQCHKP